MSVYAKKIESIRNHYAHKIKTHPYNAAIYVEFALFEELLNEYERAREIYEKATTNNHNNTNLWKKYACFELRRCDTNRCRSILEQGVQTNPREINLWLFFVEVEKDMENVKGVIDIYNRMVAENDTEEGYWHLYMFYSMVDRRLAEEILEKMDNRFGSTKIKVEKLIKMSDISAVESLMKQWDCIDEKTYVKVVEVLEQRKLLQDAFQFIKRGKYRFGSSFFKHKYRIMRKVIADEDDNAHCSKLLCEAALLEKKQDLSGAEQIYKCLLRVINREYRTKSFVKYSKFLVRREELQSAGKNYGKAIAQHLDVYEEYLSMERVLGDKARIRRIYEKYLQDSYMDARVWLELIEFEESMGEVERAEYLFENALKVLKNGVDIIEQEYNKRKYKK